MIDSNTINVILNSLESTEGRIKSTLDELIKLILKISHESEEIQDELELYEDILFHIYVYDVDYNIWLKKVGTTLTFNTSYYENVPEEMNIVHFILSKKVIKKVFALKLDPSDAYMKGLIKIQGNLTHAIIARNLLKIFFRYFKSHLAN
jgi:hypothetical protein